MQSFPDCRIRLLYIVSGWQFRSQIAGFCYGVLLCGAGASCPPRYRRDACTPIIAIQDTTGPSVCHAFHCHNALPRLTLQEPTCDDAYSIPELIFPKLICRARNVMPVPNIFHYTDRSGWNAIRSQKIWIFLASRPQAAHRPSGAYFTDIAPTDANLKTLYKRIRVPKVKQDYVFSFTGTQELSQLEGGTGRDK